MLNINLDRLNQMTVKELKDICRENGFTGFSKLRKAELVEMIKERVVSGNLVGEATEADIAFFEDLENTQEAKYAEWEQQELTRGNELPHLESLEQLMTMDYDEFLALAGKLGVCIGDPHPGQLYLTVWEAYNQPIKQCVTERQMQEVLNKHEEESKGEYSVYNCEVRKGTQDGFTPFTDYNYYNQENPQPATRTYIEWLKLQEVKLKLEESLLRSNDVPF